VLKQYVDGKISKKDLNVIVEKQEKEESELLQVKLRKVKIEKIRGDAQQKEEIDDGQPKSIKSLLSIFGGGNDDNAKKTGPKYSRTLVEEGTVGKTGRNAKKNT